MTTKYGFKSFLPTYIVDSVQTHGSSNIMTSCYFFYVAVLTYFFFFGSTGFQSQGFMLGRQALCHLSHIPKPFLF
jgi:hypothetical protein